MSYTKKELVYKSENLEIFRIKDTIVNEYMIEFSILDISLEAFGNVLDKLSSLEERERLLNTMIEKLRKVYKENSENISGKSKNKE